MEESVQEPALDDLELEPNSSDDIVDDEIPPPTVTRKDIPIKWTWMKLCKWRRNCMK